MSDFALLGTALYPHPYGGLSPKVQGASLDHALWFHRPFRADEYLLYEIDSPTASGARGFSRGSFWTQDGQLVASTAQESLLRLREEEKTERVRSAADARYQLTWVLICSPSCTSSSALPLRRRCVTDPLSGQKRSTEGKSSITPTTAFSTRKCVNTTVGASNASAAS